MRDCVYTVATRDLQYLRSADHGCFNCEAHGWPFRSRARFESTEQTHERDSEAHTRCEELQHVNAVEG